MGRDNRRSIAGGGIGDRGVAGGTGTGTGGRSWRQKARTEEEVEQAE